MTEEEWLASLNPQVMFALVKERMSPRQNRLFACACGRRYCHIFEWSAATDEYYRRVKPAVDASCEAIITVAENLNPEEVNREVALKLHSQLEGAPIGLEWDVFATIKGDAGYWIDKFPELPKTARQQGLLDDKDLREREENGRIRANLLRDIFGNPFRAVAFDPALRTDTAVAVARQMYDTRDFGAMPILADALQDAGCEDEHILNHCRDATAPHVRGCWVCDLVLNKS